jgi:probable rRNA maturation factor
MTKAPLWHVDVRIDRAVWRRLLPRAGEHCREAALAALRAEGAHPAELSIVLTDDAAIRRLNRQWRGRDRVTNVLAFPLSPAPARGNGHPGLLGDVVLAWPTIRREAEAQGKRVADHVRHLVVHGVLHLLGFDHHRAKAAMRMKRREIAILADLMIANPYRPSSPPPARVAARTRAER